MSAQTQALKEELSPEPPGDELLDSLSDDEAGTLQQVLDRTRERRAEDLQKAIDDGLDFLPRMLRKPVRSVLFPGGAQ